MDESFRRLIQFLNYFLLLFGYSWPFTECVEHRLNLYPGSTLSVFLFQSSVCTGTPTEGVGVVCFLLGALLQSQFATVADIVDSKESSLPLDLPPLRH